MSRRPAREHLFLIVERRRADRLEPARLEKRGREVFGEIRDLDGDRLGPRLVGERARNHGGERIEELGEILRQSGFHRAVAVVHGEHLEESVRPSHLELLRRKGNLEIDRGDDGLIRDVARFEHGLPRRSRRRKERERGGDEQSEKSQPREDPAGYLVAHLETEPARVLLGAAVSGRRRPPSHDSGKGVFHVFGVSGAAPSRVNASMILWTRGWRTTSSEVI